MSERITKDTQVVVGLRFYNGDRGFEGVPCRVTFVDDEAVHWRVGQDGTRARYWSLRTVFLEGRHAVLAAGDPAVPPVEP